MDIPFPRERGSRCSWLPSLFSLCCTHLSYSLVMPFGASHQVLVLLANSAICSFFRTIEVNGSENVPEDVPVIL